MDSSEIIKWIFPSVTSLSISFSITIKDNGSGIGQDDIGNLVVDQASLEKPDWMDESKIVKTLDAREIVNNGGHPVGQVLKEVRDLKSGEIYEMIAPFLPAPLIDQVAEQGYKTWTIEPDPGFFRCFFYKA